MYEKVWRQRGKCVHLESLSSGLISVHLTVDCPTSPILHSEHYTSKMLPKNKLYRMALSQCMFYLCPIIVLYFFVQANVAICSVFALLLFPHLVVVLWWVSLPIKHIDSTKSSHSYGYVYLLCMFTLFFLVFFPIQQRDKSWVNCIQVSQILTCSLCK